MSLQEINDVQKIGKKRSTGVDIDLHLMNIWTTTHGNINLKHNARKCTMLRWQWFRNRLENIADEVLAFILITILAPAIIIWIQGNVDNAWRIAILVLLGFNILLTFVLLHRLRTKKEFQPGLLVADEAGNRFFLIDSNGLYREILDPDTLYYLIDGLGLYEDIPRADNRVIYN